MIEHAAPEHTETLRPIVYLAGLAVWFILYVLGVLPGTSKRKKLLFDPNMVDVGSPGARDDTWQSPG